MGVREYHDAGERVRRFMFVDRPAELVKKTVAVGERTARPGFGDRFRKKDRGVEESVSV
jgi:hypothetical protein